MTLRNEITINGRIIGAAHPCYIIAEAGSNHNGDLAKTRELIRVAAKAGADAVKFQIFKAERLYPANAGESDYLESKRSIVDIIREMELPEAWLPELAAACAEENVDFLVTPFDEASSDLLEPYVAAYKIASYECSHLPLVTHIARKGKPLFLSTGAHDADDVDRAVQAIIDSGNDQLALLQCTAKYPAPLEALNLRTISWFRQKYQCPVGLSDHSREPLHAPLAAIALGANVIEKHFTLDNNLPGPDHIFAVTPDELREMVGGIHSIETALGSETKTVGAAEEELYAFARRSIFTLRPIAAGEQFSVDNIAVLRCGNNQPGLAPREYPSSLGRPARQALAENTAVTSSDVAEEE